MEPGPKVAMFAIARFLLGFGITFAIIAASSIIGELAYPKERARIGALFNASWFLGAAMSAGITLGTSNTASNRNTPAMHERAPHKTLISP